MEVTPPDSAALRSHGAQLRTLADDVRTVAERLERSADLEGFTGPAAERFRDSMAERASRLRRVAHDFDDLSQVVNQDSAGTAT